MAGNADLVEALTFARRRLLGAFVSGEVNVEPVPAGRFFVAGLALAGLVLAGAAITGVVAPRAAVAWQGAALVVDEDTGALYLIDDGESDRDGATLRPVVNATSGRLLAGEVTPQSVPGAVIARAPHGPPVGLPDAPPTVPTPDSLVRSGWTACTGPGHGVRVVPGGRAAVAAAEPDATVVVAADGQRWLLTTSRSWQSGVVARRHPVGGGGRADRDPPEVPEVDPDWVRLFPSAPPVNDLAVHVPGPASGEEVCAVLDHDRAGRPVVRLGVAPSGAASARGTAAGARSVSLPPGGAALVTEESGPEPTTYLVGPRGRRHLVDEVGLARLGLAAEEPAAVPERWLALVAPGVSLSPAAARRGPAAPGPRAQLTPTG